MGGIENSILRLGGFWGKRRKTLLQNLEVGNL